MLLGAVLWAGCTQPQRPYTFYAPPNAASVDDLVGALSVQGLTVDRRDDGAGVVETRWVPSSFLFGSIDERSAYLHRRFIVTMTRSGPDKRVLVRVDLRRCAPASATVGEVCAAISDGIREQDQKDLDDLARSLEDALAAP